jgi:MFS transporter, DHA2 family, metal-tetracycline-proton antiporter
VYLFKSKQEKKNINPIFLVMPWVIFLQFMQNFNENVFYLITPDIASHFGVSPAVVSWIVTVAGFSFGIGGGVYAVLADIISMRKIFVFGTIIFSAGSILGFLFNHFYYAVVIGRLIQTIGAGVIPGCLIVLIARYVPEAHKAKYFGFTTATFQLSAGIGHFAGGYIATLISWEYGFLFPVISLICLPAFLKYLPDEHLKSTKLDISGAILLAVVILLSMISLTYLNIYCFICAVCFGIYFVIYCLGKEKKKKNPFVNFSLFKNPKYTLGLVVAFLVFGTQNGMFFIFPFLMDGVYHAKASTIGLIYLPTNIAAFIIGLSIGKIVKKTGRELSVYIGIAIIIAGLLVFALFITQHIMWMAFALLLFSCGYPFFFVGYFDCFTAILPQNKIGTGMGVYNVLINLFTSLIPTIIGLIATYKVLELHILPISTIVGSAANYSNIMFLLIIMVLVAGFLFAAVFKGMDKILLEREQQDN